MRVVCLAVFSLARHCYIDYIVLIASYFLLNNGLHHVPEPEGRTGPPRGSARDEHQRRTRSPGGDAHQPRPQGHAEDVSFGENAVFEKR